MKRFKQILKGSTNVYFVLADEVSRVKIGMSDDPKQRLMELQTGSPVSLKLITSVRCDPWLEQYLHGLLEESRSHGEWFNLSERVMRIVESAMCEGIRGLVEEAVSQEEEEIDLTCQLYNCSLH